GDGTRLWDAGRIGPGPRPGPFSRARRASRASARRVLMFDVAESKRSAASRTCPLALEQPPGVLVDEPAMSDVDSRRGQGRGGGFPSTMVHAASRRNHLIPQILDYMV